MVSLSNHERMTEWALVFRLAQGERSIRRKAESVRSRPYLTPSRYPFIRRAASRKFSRSTNITDQPSRSIFRRMPLVRFSLVYNPFWVYAWTEHQCAYEDEELDGDHCGQIH